MTTSCFRNQRSSKNKQYPVNEGKRAATWAARFFVPICTDVRNWLQCRRCSLLQQFGYPNPSMKIAGTIEFLSHTSQVLQGNQLNDPYERQLPVYLPPAYQAEPDQHFPVIWVLAPFTSWGERYFNLKAWDPNIIQRYEKLLADGDAEPAILAFPDCFTKIGGSQYLNSTAVGNYQDYVIKELLPFVDAQYRTVPGRRGVMGYSSGGFGALILAMLHPDLFEAVASHSGDMAFEQCYVQDIPAAVRGIEQVGGVEAVIDSVEDIHQPGRDWFAALHMVAMSACYSPDPDADAGIALPFDLHTGELIPEVWARWTAQDPVNLAKTRLQALENLKLIYFDCGQFDEFHLFLGARRLNRLLEHTGINHIYDEFDGTHRDVNWRYAISLPYLTKALAAD